MTFDLHAHSAIRTALARESYREDAFRLVAPDLGSARWLVSTQNGLFAVGDGHAHLVAHGWFFGLARRGDRVFLFENCARRNRAEPLGRLVALTIAGGFLSDPVVIAKGLDASCHQIAFVDELLCVLDTANQCVLRFTDSGKAVDVMRPVPPARAGDASGTYMHLNSIAALPDGIALLAHNGARTPSCGSELIMLDRDWREVGRTLLPEAGCHDIVRDADGSLWHCASMRGDIICADGRRFAVAPERMSRGLAIGEDRIAVGAATFGPRTERDVLPGSVIMLDRSMRPVGEVALNGPPAVIIAL